MAVSILGGRMQRSHSLRQEAFICGCGHSGTTIVANILASHPDVYVPLKETGVFMRNSVSARIKLAILRLTQRALNKRLLVEKTPKHIRHLDLLFKLSPRARLIVPVRDGRDVAASISKRPGESLDRGIDRWIEDNTIVYSIRNCRNVFCYRYEDFVENPENVLQAMCDFLEIKWYSSLLNYHTSNRNWFSRDGIQRPDVTDHESYRNWQVNQPLFDGRNKWRQQFSDLDMSRLTQGAGADLMKSWNYI